MQISDIIRKDLCKESKMDTLIEIFRNTDVGLLIAITILGWFFYCRLKSKMDKMELRS